MIPHRDGIDRCKRRTPQESPSGSTASGSPGPSSGRPARPGGVLCKGNGGSLRVAFLVIQVAFLAVERQGSKSGAVAVSGGVGGHSGSVVDGDPFLTAFLGQFGHHTLALTVPPTSDGVRVRQ